MVVSSQEITPTQEIDIEKPTTKEEDKQIALAEKEYKEALAYVKDMISPAYMKIYPDKIRINNVYSKTFFVYAYPNFLE